MQVALDVAPVAALAKPAGQALQYECPEKALKNPGPHCVQFEAPVALNVPGPHTESVRVASVVLHAEPSGHCAQEEQSGDAIVGDSQKPAPRPHVVPQ